ncbi:hypothetical protein PHISP_01118 [Aspergillus sp. HF37]|nr:hypothetical protein PHISP_01118 [Aspergillus sp. HF37]
MPFIRADASSGVKKRSITEGNGDFEAGVACTSQPDVSFPGSDWQAWMVALGAGGVLFCTFGYVNAFG